MTKNKLICVFSLNQTLHWFIIGLLIPIMALLQLEKGLDLFQIGLVSAIYGGTVMLLELPTGGLADTIGRKRVYLISLIVLWCAGLLLLLAGNFTTVIIGFLFSGVARALSSGSLDAWFVDEFNTIEPEGNLQEALAHVGIFIPAGLGVGSLVGGLLPMSVGKITAQLPGFGIYSANLLTMNLLIIVQFLLTVILVKEQLHPDRRSTIWTGLKRFPNVVSTSIHYGINNQSILLLLLSSFAWGIGIVGLEVLWQPQVKHILGSDSQTWLFGLLATGYFLASSVGSLLSTPLCKLFKQNYPRILFHTRLFMGLFVFLLALQGHVIGFTWWYWTLFVWNGMSKSPYMAIFNAHIPESHRSTLLSCQSFFVQFGVLSGSLTMGYIAETFSIPLAWCFAAAILVISSLLYVCLPKQTANAPTLGRKRDHVEKKRRTDNHVPFHTAKQDNDTPNTHENIHN